MSFRNCFCRLLLVGVLLLLLPASVRASVLLPENQGGMAQTVPIDPLAHGAAATAYTIHPLLTAANQSGMGQYQAVNPAHAFQLRFHPEQLEVTPVAAGERPWRLTLGVA